MNWIWWFSICDFFFISMCCYQLHQLGIRFFVSIYLYWDTFTFLIYVLSVLKTVEHLIEIHWYIYKHICEKILDYPAFVTMMSKARCVNRFMHCWEVINYQNFSAAHFQNQSFVTKCFGGTVFLTWILQYWWPGLIQRRSPQNTVNMWMN